MAPETGAMARRQSQGSRILVGLGGERRRHWTGQVERRRLQVGTASIFGCRNNRIPAPEWCGLFLFVMVGS